MQKGAPNNSDFLQNWFSPRNYSPPPCLICINFKTENSSPEKYRIHWNLMNGKEFRSFKLLKLKHRRGDQIIQTICRIGSPQKKVPLWFAEISEIWQKVLWIIQNALKSNEWQRIWVLKSFKIGIQKGRLGGGQIIHFLQKWFPQKLGPPSLIFRNLNTLRKVLLNLAECIEV